MTSLLLTIVFLISGISGDSRIRAEYQWPSPSGVINNKWQSNTLAFYDRLRLDYNNWHAVFLTEKDKGEEWGDLITGGISYSNNKKLTVAAGGLRLQFAHGLVLSHPGPWSATNPLALSKPPKWRMRAEVSESPSANDATPCNGISAIYKINDYSVTATLGLSHIDPTSSGLHQTISEIASRHSITEKLAAIRIGYKFFGLSFGYTEEENQTIQSFPRAGFDLNIEAENTVFTGEFSIDPNLSTNFIFSAGRGLPDFRHTLTISRNTTNLPRSSCEFGTNNNLAGGYGFNWHPINSLTINGGALFLDREEEDLVKTAIQFAERLSNRFTITQRVKIAASASENTIQAQIVTSWSPYHDLSFSLKFPFTFYNKQDENENGRGIELRLKHNPTENIDLVLSAAAGNTDGWNSRIYAYSLSFPGEFGSKPLYNSSQLLQASAAFHFSNDVILRVKTAWFNMVGQEYLGSGDNETEGSSKTTAGIQLDWKF